MDTDIHAFRRQEILKVYPNIKKLNGPEWKSKWISLFLLFIPQLFISLNIYKLSWIIFFLVTYFVGATITQALFLAIHELSHNLFFKEIKYNKLYAIFLNLPIGIPFSISFRDYHLEHHNNLGIYGLDTDLPSKFEKYLVNSTTKKTIWLSLQIVWYALRPIFMKRYTFTMYHSLNIIVQLLFNTIIYKLCGSGPIIYFLLCDLIAGGLHPCAYHFISEHYLLNFKSNQETYSYYGKLNYLTWNVGYHNEHHDFPYIPWSRLPLVKKTLPSIYNTLIKYDSWYIIFYKFIFDKTVSLYNRNIRRYSI
jgi:sphingolipid delta-4 desaturase